MTAPKLFIGQVLYMPPSRRSDSWVESTVTKIGRVWAHLGISSRCTIDTLYLDCGKYSPIQLYTSKDAYISEKAIAESWRDLCKAMERQPTSGVTLEIIAEARKLLLLTAKDES